MYHSSNNLTKPSKFYFGEDFWFIILYSVLYVLFQELSLNFFLSMASQSNRSLNLYFFNSFVKRNNSPAFCYSRITVSLPFRIQFDVFTAPSFFLIPIVFGWSRDSFTLLPLRELSVVLIWSIPCDEALGKLKDVTGSGCEITTVKNY